MRLRGFADNPNLLRVGTDVARDDPERPVVLVAHIVLVIQAILKANKGESVRYPFTLRVIN